MVFSHGPKAAWDKCCTRVLNGIEVSCRYISAVLVKRRDKVTDCGLKILQSTENKYITKTAQLSD